MKHRLCATADVAPAGATRFEVDGTPVCVVRAGDRYFAIGDTCTHAEASLSEGYVDVSECTIECPLHSAVFSLRTGEALEFPAEDPVARYEVTVDGTDLYIELPGE